MAALNYALHRIRARKRAAVELLELAGSHLTPGTYYVDPWGHLRHLVHGRWSMDVGRMNDPDREADPFGPLKTVARWSMAAALPPTFINVRSRPEAKLERELQGVFALPTGDRNAVLLTRDGRNAVRVYRGGRVPADEARIRPILERELRLPPSRIMEGEGLIVEEYVRGRPLRYLPEAERERIFRALIVGYASVTDGHASLAPDDVVVAGDELREQAVSRWQLPSSSLFDWDHLERPVPVIPSHGDVCSDNLLVREDGSYTLIDYERCEFLPYYFDSLNLTLREFTNGRHDLVTALLEGRFDAELALLWSSAGKTYSRQELWRALAMVLLVHVRRGGKPMPVDWSTY